MRNRITRWIVAIVAVASASVAIGSVPVAAATPRISDVRVYSSGVSIGVNFAYKGSGPVTLTVGRTLNVKGTAVAQQVAKQPADGRWYLGVDRLDASTRYTLRIDAPGAAPWTYFGTVSTWTRHVDLVWHTAHVLDDGDGVGRGCGDFFFSSYYKNGGYDRLRTGAEHCISSGSLSYLLDPVLDLSSVSETRPTMRIEMYAWDDDRTWNVLDDWGNYGSLYTTSECGDLGYGWTYVDLTESGSRTVQVAALGSNVDMNDVDVWFSGTLTVSYSPPV